MFVPMTDMTRLSEKFAKDLKKKEEHIADS
jgi:hypothetical protein